MENLSSSDLLSLKLACENAGCSVALHSLLDSHSKQGARIEELEKALESAKKLLQFLPTEYVHRNSGKPLCYSPDGALAQICAALKK